MSAEMPLDKVVAVHSGLGSAYMMASLFVVCRAKDGRWIWRNSGIGTLPRGSARLAWEDAHRLAEAHGTVVADGYGSLHNKRVRPITLDHDHIDIVRAGIESGEL
jgi:hypothetical protein